ncbi:response regulator transcription factor [Microbacterium sp. cx-59]|uniref:response regulator transcription factor n=1 Tax=Microbacterium sp. cx-59 TaxID=2891207 RepID=UPI001E292FC7|nr:response regulator transcription factor [Microbacterium sp. cx-59]MCC4908248.1 response regulator transcription factor [Microbacterium sp. cx-59]
MTYSSNHTHAADSPQNRTAVIVEDDPDIRLFLGEILESAGFSTISVGNHIDGIRAARAYQPDLITMDIAVPGLDGFEATRRLRTSGYTGYIIMVTSFDEPADMMMGLSAGADDYVTKPFVPRLLRARIEAGMRRIPIATRDLTQSTASSSLGLVEEDAEREPARLPPDDAAYVWEGIRVDPPTRTVSVDGGPVRLTVTEFNILEALVRNAPNVVTFEMIGHALFDQGVSELGGSARYRTHVANLRQKLGEDSHIESVRSVGYKMVST